MKNILLTGGAGFIGSHTCLELIKEGTYNITIVDNLANSKEDVINKLNKIVKINFYKINLLDINLLDDLFKKNNFDIVIHFAGLKSVGESVKKPIMYFKNNINITLNLIEVMEKYNCYNLIFSSSTTVYGDSKSPLTEDSNTGIGISNPYGRTKHMIELILKDLSISSKKWKITSLRYFNPVGADKSGLIGEDPNGVPNNLMPYLLKVAVQNNLNKFIDERYSKLNVFGNNYNTKDGTCVRDYIHVTDLALGHIAAIKKLKYGFNCYNLGTGKGYTVLEIINTFKNVNSVKLPYQIVDKRDGDLYETYCLPKKALIELEWSAKYNLEDICIDSWNFVKNNIY